MKKYILLLFIFVVGTFFRADAKIIEVNHFLEIVSHANADTLLILDIDDTLLIPVQMLGCDEWFRLRLKKHQTAGLSSSEALEKSLAEWEAVRHLTKMEIVEPQTEEIISQLQKKGFPIMGLTTQGLALATRTVQQLKESHIDLSITAPQENCYIHLYDHGILYRNGILFTAGLPKGEALFRLCEKMGYRPKKIVFINDKASHLLEVESEAQKYGIEFVGLRYAFSDLRKAAFCPEIAEFQFTHSTFEHLLSDEETRALINR